MTLNRIKQIVLGTLLLSLFWASINSLEAQSLTRDKVIKAFNDFSRASSSKSLGKFNIDIDGQIRTYESGVKIWFELADGRYVDPTKHKWQRNERFKIWFESPVPAVVALYQNYQHDQLKSRQVYPDDRYPETFRVVPAGVSVSLPVQFKMDNDLEDELMSLILVRTDDNETIPNDYSDDTDFGSNSELSGEGGSMKGKVKPNVYSKLNTENNKARVLETKKGTKFEIDIIGGNPGTSQNYDDVAVIVFAKGKITQVQFALHKD